MHTEGCVKINLTHDVQVKFSHFFYHNFGILTGNQIGAKSKRLNIKSRIQSGVEDQHHNIKSGIQTVAEGQ